MPKNKKKISIFEGRGIRREWNEAEEKWYFSVVDVVATLTEQADFQVARKYWNKLKERLNDEGSEMVTNCHQLKMLSADGKLYCTDAVNNGYGLLTAGLFFAILEVAKTTRSDPFGHGGF